MANVSSNQTNDDNLIKWRIKYNQHISLPYNALERSSVLDVVGVAKHAHPNTRVGRSSLFFNKIVGFGGLPPI